MLGVSNLTTGPTIGSVALASDGTAATNLQATLDFAAAMGTTGPLGFFQAPNPFNIVIGSQAGGNGQNTTYTDNGTLVRVSTFTSNRGGGSLAFTSQQVPEPSVLALAGLALIGAGLARKRAKKVAA